MALPGRFGMLSVQKTGQSSVLRFCATIHSYFPRKVAKKVGTFLFCSWRSGDVACPEQEHREPTARSQRGVTDSCSVVPSGHVSSPASAPGRRISSSLFENTVNTWTCKNNCLDANGLFLIAFQFLNVGSMLK